MWSAFVPNALLGWLERRRALRDLKNIQGLDESVLELDDRNLVNRAMVALRIGDRDVALQHWNEALSRYPAYAKRSRDALCIMLGLEQFDEADALMLAGMKRVPGDRFYAEGYAQVAERRGDTEAAIERWNRVRKKFPATWLGYVQGADCLLTAGQVDAAEALNAKALERFPGVKWTWVQWAYIAEHRRDWPEALRRWEATGERFPGQVIDIGVAKAMEELGRFEEAEARLTESQAIHPLAFEIAVSLARLANLRGDKDAVLLRWADNRRRFPLLPLCYREEVRHLSEMDRHADADAVLLAAVKRFPTAAWPTVEYASLASARQDWTEAETRWAAVRAAWPDRPDGYDRGAQALAALGRQDEAALLRAEHQDRSA